jgi:hypothetical protein
VRLLLASKDPVTVDAVHACIMGVDPIQVDYLRFVSEAGLGTLDTARIDVVGNARVDEVRKPFPMAKGLCRLLWGRPAKTRFEDFEGPRLAVESLSIRGTTLKARIAVDPKDTRLVLQMDGLPPLTFHGNLDRIQGTLDREVKGGMVTVEAFDRYFNCSMVSVEPNMQTAA